MKFYRFELAFSGEPQDVGFLQGLDDVGLDDAERQALYQPFNEYLKSREVETDDGSDVVCFFTEAGVSRFKRDIDNIIQAIAPMGWSLLGTVMEEADYEFACYHDEYQAAWSRTYLGGAAQYIEIRAVEDIL